AAHPQPRGDHLHRKNPEYMVSASVPAAYPAGPMEHTVSQKEAALGSCSRSTPVVQLFAKRSRVAIASVTGATRPYAQAHTTVPALAWQFSQYTRPSPYADRSVPLPFSPPPPHPPSPPHGQGPALSLRDRGRLGGVGI